MLESHKKSSRAFVCELDIERKSEVSIRSEPSRPLRDPAPPGSVESMGLRATVRNGRLVLDQPTDLPEGTVLDLVLDDEGDELDEEQRAALDAAISRSLAQEKAGKTAPVEELLARLRSHRKQ